MKVIISIILLALAVFSGVLLYERHEDKEEIAAQKERQQKLEDIVNLYKVTLINPGQGDSLINDFREKYSSDDKMSIHLRTIINFAAGRQDEIVEDIDFELLLTQRDMALKSARDTIKILEGVNQGLFAEKEYIIDDFLKSGEKQAEELLKREKDVAKLESKADSLKALIARSQQDRVEMTQFKSPTGVEVTYFGQIKNGKADGEGVAFYANGNKYDGEWTAGKKHGRGKYTYPNGERYEGKFVEDRRDGFGQYFWPNGDIYTGFWMNDRRHGKGLIKDYTGKVVSSGEWTNDALSKSMEVNF